MSAMLISIIPSMPRGYMKMLLPTPRATLKNNCPTVETSGEGLRNSNRLLGHMKLNNTILVTDVGYV
jgi:hypothetical protein